MAFAYRYTLKHTGATHSEKAPKSRLHGLGMHRQRLCEPLHICGAGCGSQGIGMNIVGVEVDVVSSGARLGIHYGAGVHMRTQMIDPNS